MEDETGPDGIAAADAHLGRPFPLPALPLPLVRWSEVQLLPGGVELELNLDDSRGGPGRLAIYAGQEPPPGQGLPPAVPLDRGFAHSYAPLDEAQESLKPVHELVWQAGDLHLRLTAQGPWAVSELMDLAASLRI